MAYFLQFYGHNQVVLRQRHFCKYNIFVLFLYKRVYNLNKEGIMIAGYQSSQTALKFNS